MASAVATAFRDAGFGGGTIVARNAETGSELADRLGYAWQAEVGGLRAPVVVNVTPIGMAGGPEVHEPAFDDDVIASATTVFDVVAMPSETTAHRGGTGGGKQVITGAEVIALQALNSSSGTPVSADRRTGGGRLGVQSRLAGGSPRLSRNRSGCR